MLLLYLASYQNCDKGQLVLEKVKKGRKVALIFPGPGWRGNSHILPVYETGVGSLLNWLAEEGRPRSGVGVLESLQGLVAFQEREKGSSGSRVGNGDCRSRGWEEARGDTNLGLDSLLSLIIYK